jgi:D-glycero-alpha-D-manno-heptose-7-phosphate kinase
MSIEKILSKAPTRIDLAGGTLDIWPLYLFLDSPVTLNLGIDLFAEADLAVLPSGEKVHLVSEDQKIEARFGWDELQTVAPHPALELHTRLLRYFAPKKKSCPPISLRTRAKSPAGAGLGGSSALSVAIIGALASWVEETPVDPLRMGEKLIDIVRDVETKVIRVPAGLQDYYGAMFGGLQSLKWLPAVHERRWLPVHALQGLEKRTLLFYSGQSRNSGINNWALFKAFIDGEAQVRDKFARIASVTKELEAALEKSDWSLAGKKIAEEWTVRHTLAPGISTPEIDQAFKTASSMAKVSGKICGAGGGGCFFVYFEDAAELESAGPKIVPAFEKLGIRKLPYHATARGLEVQVNPQGISR